MCSFSLYFSVSCLQILCKPSSYYMHFYYEDAERFCNYEELTQNEIKLYIVIYIVWMVSLLSVSDYSGQMHIQCGWPASSQISTDFVDRVISCAISYLWMIHVLLFISWPTFLFLCLPVCLSVITADNFTPAKHDKSFPATFTEL